MTNDEFWLFIRQSSIVIYLERFRPAFSQCRSTGHLLHQGETGTAHLKRGLIIRFSDASSAPRRRGQRITFEVELAPRATWHCCVDLTPVIDGKPMLPRYRCRSFTQQDNAYDRRKLTDPDFQQRVATAVCAGLRRYVEGNGVTGIQEAPVDGGAGSEVGSEEQGDAYCDGGVDALRPRKAKGSVPKIPDTLADEIRRWVIEGPVQQGLDRAVHEPDAVPLFRRDRNGDRPVALDDRRQLRHEIVRGRAAWLQVLRGSVNVLGNDLSAGDGVAVTDENAISVQAAVPSEVLLFDLA